MGRRQFGLIRKLPSGRWQASYHNAKLGKRVTAPTTFSSKADANAWLSSQETALRSGRPSVDPKGARVRLDAYAAEWLEGRPLRDRTREVYASILRVDVLPYLGDLRLDGITPQVVRSWHASLLKSKPTMAPKAYRLLRTILTTAIDDGVLAENPCRVKGAGSERVVERSIRPSRRWKSSSMRSSPAIGLRSCSPRIAGCARESARTWRADTSSWKQSAPRHLTSVSSGRLVGGELPFVVPAAALRAGWFDLSVSFHAAEPLENGFSGEVQFGGEVLGGAWSGAEE